MMVLSVAFLVSALPAPPADVHLVHITPLHPDAAWPAGLAMNYGQTWMTRTINANPRLLPNHRLVVTVVDGFCSPSVAQTKVLELLLRKEVDKAVFYDPLQSEMDANTHTHGVGLTDWINLLEYSDSVYTYGQVRATDVRFVGVLGDGCSGATKAAAPILAAARKPQVAHGATSPSLSDRDAFPYFWRTIVPDSIPIAGMATIGQVLGFQKYAIFTSTKFAGWVPALVEAIQASNWTASAVGRPLSEATQGAHNWPTKGFYLTSTDANAELYREAVRLVDEFKRTPARYIITLLYEQEHLYVACAMYQAGIRGHVMMYLGGSPASWYQPSEDDLLAIPCTEEQLGQMNKDSLILEAVRVREDVGGVHTCADGSSYAVDPVAIAADIIAATDKGGNFRSEVYPTADGVCMWALALHELLEVRGKTVEELYDMTEDTFELVQSIFANTTFDGMSGVFSYAPRGDGSRRGPDPAGDVSVMQAQGERDHNGVMTRPVVGIIKGGKTVEWNGKPLIFGAYDEFVAVEADSLVGVPLQAYAVCPEGRELGFERNLCSGCTTGSQYDHALGACRPCPAGFGGHDGRCEACPPGSFQGQKGQANCTLARPGYFQAKAVASAEEPCPAGTFSDAEGSSKCTPCPIGTFASSTGSSACTACPSTFTTPFRTTVHVRLCTCPGGTFWNRATDKCDACQEGGFCFGGLAPPLIYESFFARFDPPGSSDAAVLAAQQAAKVAGTYERRPSAFTKMVIWKCASELDCPSEDTLVLPAELGGREEIRVEDLNLGVGVRRPNDCPPGRQDIACAVCEANRFGPECSSCEGQPALAITVVGMLILPLMMFLMGQWYRDCDYEVRADGYFLIGAMGGLALFYGQCVGIMSNMSIDWHAAVNASMKFSRMFLLDLSDAVTMCVTGTSFLTEYWVAFFVPLVFVVAMLVAQGVSQLLPPVRSYDLSIRWECSVNVLGTIFAALYVYMAQSASAFFECVANPAAPATLAKYKQVECGSEQHNQATAPMVLSMFFYVAGFFCLCLVLAIVAPRYFGRKSFRECSWFLVYRWNPNMWYFSVTYMVRNVLVANVNSMSDDGSIQLVLMGSVLLLFTALMCLTRPWKSATLCYVDCVSSAMLIILLFFGYNVLFCNEKIRNLRLDGKIAQVGAVEQFIKKFTSWIVYGNVLLGVGIVVLLAQIANGLRPSVQFQRNEMEQFAARNLRGVFGDMCAHPQFIAALQRTIEIATPEETAAIRALTSSVVHRLGDADLASRFHGSGGNRISRKSIVANPVDLMKASVSHQKSLMRVSVCNLTHTENRAPSPMPSNGVSKLKVPKAAVVPVHTEDNVASDSD